MGTKLAEPVGGVLDFDHDLALALRGEISVASFVQRLARERKISYEQEPLDDFAGAVSRLSDAEVEFDEIELLVVALRRNDIVTPKQAILLHAAYLRQKAQ